MLNEDLKKDIELEIEKASDELREFLHSEYFRDTMSLIIKVNKLDGAQAESVELETVLMVLGINDHDSIDKAIATECGIQGEETARQVTKDIKEYIIDKIEKKATQVTVTSGEESSAPLRNIIHDAYGKELLGPVSIDYYDKKRKEMSAIASPNTPVNTEQKAPIIQNENKAEIELVLPEVMGSSDDTNNGKTLNTKVGDPLPDVYRELADEDDYKVQKDEVL